MDAGGLAQMTYNSHFNGLNAPNAGFASRGKGSHIKRLSVALPPKISTIDETRPIEVGNTPRTSRGHLLAGLRTAPKSATLPPSNVRSGFDYKASSMAQPDRTPQTATGAFFPQNTQGDNYGTQRQMYSLPEQVLAPPTIEIDANAGDVDQEYYQNLMATNAMLAQQQRMLQQQLLNLTQASQQFGGLDLNDNTHQSQQATGNLSSLYSQQMQQGLQPIVQSVPNNPGYYSVYSPMTGQQTLVMDNSQFTQQQEIPQAYPTAAKSASPPTPSFRAQVSPPPETSPSPVHGFRARSPPKPAAPAQDVEPLPPPSANAFRRGHKKSLSFINGAKEGGDATKPSGPRSAGFPQTPMSGTFGPGHGREGRHPERQPRGPPPLEEILAKPTSKYEGSKNFVARQRRDAIQNLVRAGAERRSELRQSGSGSATPGSDGEFNFSVSSGEDDNTVPTSGSLSGRPSIGSLRAAASGAIGSERKKSRDRERHLSDGSSGYSVKSLASEENLQTGFKMTESENTKRRTPMLVLSSAEKRKSAVV